MFCRIAELLIEVPEAGDLVPRCQEYLLKKEKTEKGADISIRTDLFQNYTSKNLTKEQNIYLESGAQFQWGLLRYRGLILHSSAVAMGGRGYLFSAPCGTGKSTHTRIWQSEFGEAAKVFNDDKPALRLIEDKWYAYGTPWCGKDGININMKVPVAGICFLKQASENRIRRLNQREAVQRILWQTTHFFKCVERLDMMLPLVESLVQKIPVFELENRPEPEAARLSYETMRRAAEEMGL